MNVSKIVSICKEGAIYVGKSRDSLHKGGVFEEVVEHFLSSCDSVEFVMAPGEYEIHRGIRTQNRSTVFTGEGKVVFSGLKDISSSAIAPPKAGRSDYRAELKGLDLLKKPVVGKWFRTRLNSELFVNGTAFRPCSSRDIGLELSILEVLAGEDGGFKFDFDFSADKRPGVAFIGKHNGKLKINHDLTGYDLRNSLLYGFFTWNWADEYEWIDCFQDGFLALAGGSTQYGFTKNQKAAILNSPSFLRKPGTFCIDYENEAVSFCLEAGHSPDRVSISYLSAPFIRADKATSLALNGITFVGCHTNAIELETVESFSVKGCVFQNIQGYGIYAKRHKKAVICKNRFEDSAGGIYFYDPKRSQKENTRTRITRNAFERFDRYNQTLPPAIFSEINGVTIALNTFRDANSWAIDINGDHTCVFLNKFESLVNAAGDIGVINHDRSWTLYRNSVFLNLFRNIGGFVDESFFNHVSAVYMDTLGSGLKVFLNYLSDCDIGIFINGGSFNKVFLNVFRKCNFSLFISAIGETWAKKMAKKGGSYGLYENYETHLADKKPLRKKIDKIGGIDRLILPRGNKFRYNVSFPENRIHFLDHRHFPYEDNNVGMNLSPKKEIKTFDWNEERGRYIETSEKRLSKGR